MLQRVFLNVLLASFLVSFMPCAKGWDISQDMGQKISNVVLDPHELLSYAVPLSFISYLVLSAYNRYRHNLEKVHYNEEVITTNNLVRLLEGNSCNQDVLDFIRIECERAGHPNPEKIQILLLNEAKVDFSRFPRDFSAFKTPKYDVILLSDTDCRSLEKLFVFRHDINSFRRHLFYAGMEMVLRLEDEATKNCIRFLESILYSYVLVDNEETADDIPHSRTSCESDYHVWIKDVEEKLSLEVFKCICPEIKLKILRDLKKIVYLSDEYLGSCLDKVLDMWAATIHHESDHLQSKIPLGKLKVVLNSLVPLTAYSVSNILSSEISPYKRLGIVLFGTTVGLLLSKFVIYFVRYFEECNADNNVVNKEKYLLADAQYFLHVADLEERALGFAWQKGFSAFIKHVYSCLTDVHPWSTSRARKCIQRAKKLKQSIL